jgi:hypothetical protein
MKQTRRFFQGLVACGIALAMVISLAAQTTDEVAKVVRIKGEARYTTGGGIWNPLKVGDVLRPGALIQTDTTTGSFVDLVIGDGSVTVASVAGSESAVLRPTKGGLVRFQPAGKQNALRVWENTALGLDKMTAMSTGADVVTETQLDLKQGHITGIVKKMSGASRYEIKLPNGVAGIRGTVYDLWADGRIRVMTGAMVYSYFDSQNNLQTVEIPGGSSYTPGAVPPVSRLSGADMQWFTTVVGALGVAAYTPAPVTLDQTTYYVQPRLSPTEGAAPPPEGD